MENGVAAANKPAFWCRPWNKRSKCEQPPQVAGNESQGKCKKNLIRKQVIIGSTPKNESTAIQSSRCDTNTYVGVGINERLPGFAYPPATKFVFYEQTEEWTF